MQMAESPLIFIRTFDEEQIMGMDLLIIILSIFIYLLLSNQVRTYHCTSIWIIFLSTLLDG